MSELNLEASVREQRGRGGRNRLNGRGMLPAVVYGKAAGSIPIEVGVREMEDILQGGRNALVNLSIKGNGGDGSYKVLVKEVQRDVLRQTLIHIDFQQVSLHEKVQAGVPVQLAGESPGVKEGGLLQHTLRNVEISCLPGDIPEYLVLNVDELELNESLTVSRLVVPPGVEVQTAPDTVVVSVLAPRTADVADETGTEQEQENDGDGDNPGGE